MAIDRDKILKVAETLVQKGKVEQAIKEYQKLLKANPSDSNTINRIGDLYGRIGQIDKAIELYEKIAEGFSQDGFATKAIAIFKKINRLAPQRLDIFERLADLYLGQNLIVEAKNQYQVIADWYVKVEDIPNAIKIHKKLIELDENNHMGHLRLADLLIQAGQPLEGIAAYDRLGRLLLDRDKLDEAERLYRHALDKSPPEAGFVAPLCDALLDAGRSGQARDFLNDAIKISPNDHDLQVVDVRVCLAFGNADLARKKAEMILAQRPDDTNVRVLVGRAMINAGQGASARDLLLPVAETKLKNGDFTGAQDTIETLVKAMPQDQQVLKIAVRAYEPTGDKEMAFTLKAALADSHFRAGQHHEARSHYLALAKSEPDNNLFKQRLAQINGAAHEEWEPVAEEGPVVEESPRLRPASELTAAPPEVPVAASEAGFDPDERFAEANVFAKYGLSEKALNHYIEIVKHFPDHLKARETLAALYIEQGKIEAAIPVAKPLVEYYSANGHDEQLAALCMAIPDLASGAALPAPPPSAPREKTTPAAPIKVEAVVSPELLSEDDDDIILVDIDSGEFPAVELDTFDSAIDVEAAGPEVGEELGFNDFAPVDEDVPVIEDFAPVDEDVPVIEVVTETPYTSPIVAEPAVIPKIEPVTFADVNSQAAAPEKKKKAFSGGALSQLDALERLVFDTPTSSSGKTKKAEPTVDLFAVTGFDPVADVSVEIEAVNDLPEDLVEISDSLGGPPVSDIEQLDFFIQQELYEDAIRTLGQLEAGYPNDSEISQRRLQLKAKGVLLEDVAALDNESEELFDEEEDFFDLAKELEEELAEEEAMVEEATGATKDEAELEEVFREFQKGVAEQLSEEDADTHFNLGIAYKEMGLLAESIREFQIASRDVAYFVECCTMIGVCYIEQGLYEQAAEWYTKATTAPGLDNDAVIALNYELAGALEYAGDSARAVELFQEIADTCPGFRDVNERLVFLSGAVN